MIFCTFLSTLAPTLCVQLAGLALNPQSLTQVNALPHKVLIADLESQFKAAEQLRRQGDAQLKRQEFQAALQSYQQSIQILRELKLNDDNLEEALIGMAKTYLLMGDNPKALSLFKQLSEAKDHNNEPALTNLGLALFNSGKLLEAEQVLQKAIAGWEKRRKLEQDDLSKITKLEQQSYSYRLLQKVLVKQNKTEAALLIAEQMRGRTLVEQIVQNSGLPATPPPNLEQIKQIAKTTNSTLVEYSIVGNEIHVFGNEPDDETDLFIWVVQPNGIISFRQVDLRQLPDQSLTKLILKTRQESLGINGRGAVGVVERPNTSKTVRANLELQNLSQLLIEPIAGFLPKDSNAHVIFIPQKALFLVPFAALQDSSGKYLIEQHTLLSASSIQVLALTNRQRPNTSGTKNALVVGNPTMPTLPAQGNTAPGQLNSLPGAEKEALAVASLLNTQALTGNRATKASIVQQMPQQRIIHLATHGLLDFDANFQEFGEPTDKNATTARDSGVIVKPGVLLIGPGTNVSINGVPAAVALAGEKVIQVSMPGAIALAPSNGDNGFLTAKEILGLKLNNTEIVVLSACDTGRGRITGEGVVGLSRAFIAAGVKSVIVSLWSVPDAPTASLMTEFYRQLPQTPDRAQALRQAMLTTKTQFPNPIDWAAFTLIGAP
jgi:CHAT domain-containing protein